MKPTNITARDLNEAFYKCCKVVLEEGHDYLITRGSYEGTYRRELDYVTIHVARPWTLPLTPTLPEGLPSPANDAAVEAYMPYLMTGVIQENEEYTYGQYLEQQIEEVIARYKASGEGNNQLCMTIGDKDSIFQKDPPCMRSVDTKLRGGVLNFAVYFRSWDLWAGLPMNLGGLELLKAYMADMIGVENGELIAASKGLHLYQYAWNWAKQVVRST